MKIAQKVGALLLLMMVTLALMYPWQAGWSTGYSWLWMAGVAAIVVLISTSIRHFNRKQGADREDTMG
ncbi:hypothetical protein ACFQ7N_19345 [Streptomyces niveus]|uniref:hypothetical protein n=1 Tax=Streptomyces niveus TaxID=193462 RepID=UPI003699A2C6